MIFPSKYLDASTFVLTSETLTEYTEYGLNVEVAKRGSPHRWTIEFRTIGLDHTNARGLNAFLNSLEGRFNTFTMQSPLPWLSPATSITASSSVSAGASEIPVLTGLNNTTGAILAGELIKFAGHDKVYEVQEDVDTNGTGGGTMKITPNLFSDVSNLETINKAVFTLRLSKDNVSLSLSANNRVQPVTITAKENV